MAIDIQRLIQYIRMANHNNAEGEANTAARRVCKILEDDKFSCINGYVDDTRRRPIPPPKPKEPEIQVTYYDEWGTDSIFEELLKRIKYGTNQPFKSTSVVYTYECNVCGTIISSKDILRPPHVCNNCKSLIHEPVLDPRNMSILCPKCYDTLFSYIEAVNMVRKLKDKIIKCKKCGTLIRPK